ncbi:MAG TPA: hypothetical protein VNA66_11425 [Gammaproteobacteria bacterium]|nr:hypothetical protein [Gammaproteobacteria bacterium]
MPLEAGDGFISGLVSTNPVNATDQVAQGDDHLRLIKTALLGTFPNLSGAMTLTHGNLNALAPFFTDPNASRIMFWDDSAGAFAFLAASTGLSLSGTNLAIDTAVVPRLAASNTYTSASPQRYQDAGSMQLYLEDTGAGSNQKVWMLRSDGGEFVIQSLDDALSGVENAIRLTKNTSGEVTLVALAADSLTFAGPVTTPDATATEVGYKGAPQSVQDGNYTLVLTDAGRSIDKQAGGAGETITIPANASVAFPVGTIICGDNDGGGALTIAITSDTLEDSAGNTGSRTVADNGSWQIKKIASTKWRITGSGIS